jgi:hypothetical protein
MIAGVVLLGLLPLRAPAAVELGQQLREAATIGDSEKVAELLANGADVNARECTGKAVSKVAAEGGHPEVVKLLKAHGAK